MRHGLFQIRRLLAGALAAVTVLTAMPAPAFAQEAEEQYPYTLFAGAEVQGAVTLDAEFLTVNGAIAANGTVILGENANRNGALLENAAMPMPVPDAALLEGYFPEAGTERYPADYSMKEENITRHTPLETEGSLALSGNINLYAGIKAKKEIVLAGNSLNADGAVIYSEQGDITAEFFNVNFTGLIYAPHGEVRITAPYVNLNRVLIIADRITVNAESANINYNEKMACFFGAHAEGPAEDEKEENPGEETELLDSDGDGLPDLLELSLGTDINQADTDGDGLTDYEEVCYTGTDPLKYDSVTEGLSDAMADSDGDGLSNAEELALGTNPLLQDTDEDGLSDYEEVNRTGTDPLLADTDADGLPDGDEIKIGLDPGNPATFGVPDAEYRVEQEIAAESEALEAVNTKENPYRLSLDITAAGYVEGSLSVRESSYAGVIQNEAVLGMIPELSYPQEDGIGQVTLRFEISGEYTENMLGLFPEEEEFAGIRRLNVFQYFEELNMLLPIETKFDMEHNTVYAETDGLGTYCIMDMELWLAGLGIMGEQEEVRTAAYAAGQEELPAPEIRFEGDMSLCAPYWEIPDTVDKAPDAPALLTEEAVPAMEGTTELQPVRARGAVKKETPVELVFLLQSAGSSEENFFLQLMMIHEVTERIYDEYEEVRVCIIEYGEKSASFAGSYSYPVWQPAHAYLFSALERLQYTETNAFCNRGAAFSLMKGLDFRENAAKFVFHLANGSSTIHGGFLTELDVCARQNINYTEILPMGFYYMDEGFGKQLRDAIAKTNGLSLTYTAETPEIVYEHIVAHIAPAQVRFEAILPTGWQTVVLNGILDPENGVDTDGDGLTDWEEADTDRLRWDTDGSVILPSIQECMAYPEKPYAETGLDRFVKSTIGEVKPDPIWQTTLRLLLKNTYVLPVHSDPSSADSDGDSYSDYAEVKKYNSNPLKNEVTLLRWNQEYISVEYAGSKAWDNNGSPFSYGGSQMWFYNEEHKDIFLGNIIQSCGCGLISVSDILLYLALENPKYSTMETEKIMLTQDDNGKINYESYISYIYQMYLKDFSVMPEIGILGPVIASGINQYSARNGFDFRAKWCASKEKLLPRIEKMLRMDIPVTFSIGPMGEHGVYFYNWMPKENDTYCFEVENDEGLVSGHYVTVTGLLVDDVKKQTMLELSSWGYKFYLNYDEYIRTVEAHSNYLFSNIVYIERQQRK